MFLSGHYIFMPPDIKNDDLSAYGLRYKIKISINLQDILKICSEYLSLIMRVRSAG